MSDYEAPEPIQLVLRRAGRALKYRERRIAVQGGTDGQIAVKVIDDRGNELTVVKSFEET